MNRSYVLHYRYCYSHGGSHDDLNCMASVCSTNVLIEIFPVYISCVFFTVD